MFHTVNFNYNFDLIAGTYTEGAYEKDSGINVRMTEELAAVVETIANDFHNTPSGLVRALLEEFVAAYKTHGRDVKWPPAFVHVTATSSETGVLPPLTDLGNGAKRVVIPHARRPGAAPIVPVGEE